MNYFFVITCLLCLYYAQGFITGCSRFNPTNFNECFQCAQGNYLDKGNCLPCQSQSSHADCKPKEKIVNNEGGPLLVGFSNSQSSANQGLTSSTSGTSSSSTSSSGQTSSAAAEKKKKSTTSLMALLAMLPPHCVYFTFGSSGMKCQECEGGFDLKDNECVKKSQQITSATQETKTNEIPAEETTATESTQTDNSTQVEKGSEVNEAEPVQTADNETLEEQAEANVTEVVETQKNASQPAQTTDQTSTPEEKTSPPTLPTSTPKPTQVPLPTTPQAQTQTQSTQPSVPTTVIVAKSAVQYPNPNHPKDPNCLKVNPAYSLSKPIGPDNKRCLMCYHSFYYKTKSQFCQPQNPLCKQCDPQNNCLSCYPGYILIKGNCQINNGRIPYIVTYQNNVAPSGMQDPNCRQYDYILKKCKICASRYYPDSKTTICHQVDPTCRTYDPATGECQTCYTGYTIDGANPLVCTKLDKRITTASSVTDPNKYKAYCKRIRNNICVQCVHRYFLFNGLCFPVSDLCKTYNPTFGFCTSCYDGYETVEGICQVSQAASNYDPFCIKIEGRGCGECITSYYPQKGICTMVSGLCNGYNRKTGHCTDCFPPYTLVVETGSCQYLQ